MKELRKISEQELNKILTKHESWLKGFKGGKRANLSYTDLSYFDLSYSNLRLVNLSHSNLYRAILNGADMRDVDLSGAKGLISPIEFLNKNFEKTDEGYIAYKIFNYYYGANPNWKIEVGSVIEEEVNYNRVDDCGCGINVATLDWVKQELMNSTVTIYKILIRNEWLMGVCVPYNTDGKIRCAKAEIIGIVEG